MPNSLPVPSTIVANTNPTAAAFNSYRDALQQLQGGAPTGGQGARDFFAAVQATTQTGLAASSWVSITFATTSEIVDIAGGHDPTTNPSRYVGKMPGWYRLTGGVAIIGSATGQQRMARFALNGTLIPGTAGITPPSGTAFVSAAPYETFVYMNGTTDYVELQGWADFANWGTTITTSSASRFQVEWVHS